MSDLARGLGLLRDKRPDYVLADRYYDGDVEEVFTSANIERLIGKLGDRFRVNFAGIPVDKLVRRVEFASAVVEGDERLTKLLTDIHDAIEYLNEVKLALHSAAKFGDAYLIAQPGEMPGSVETFYNSPLAAIVIYSDENPREPAFGLKQWKFGKRYRTNLFYPDRIEKYVTRLELAVKGGVQLQYDAASFEPFEDDDDDGIELIDYGFPVTHLRHGGLQYGVPAHKKAYGPQDIITKVVSTQMAGFDGVGFPVRYGLLKEDGDGMAEDWGDDTLIDADDDEIEARRRQTTIKNRPGDMTLLEGVDKVGEFTAADPDSFLKPLDKAIEILATVTDTPLEEVYPGATPPSGESRRQSHAAINAHAGDFKATILRPLERHDELMLRIAGHDRAKVKVSFYPSDRIADKEGWDVIASKIAVGVPLRTVLTEAGYEDSDIASWYPDDVPAFGPTELTRLATALQAIGQAKMLGVLGDEQIRTLIPQVFTSASTETGDPIPLPGVPAILPVKPLVPAE